MSAAAAIFPSTLQIPVDFTISKRRFGLVRDDELTVRDAHGNKVYRIVSSRSSLPPSSSSPSSPPRRVKTLFDIEGNPLISAVHRDDGWQCFKGNGREHDELMFSVKKILDRKFKSELEVFLSGTSIADQQPNFRLKGNPFCRSCTIYNGGSIIAQTYPLYRFRKSMRIAGVLHGFQGEKKRFCEVNDCGWTASGPDS